MLGTGIPVYYIPYSIQYTVHYIYIIDQANLVKMATHWPSSVFAFSFGSVKTQKENEANIQPLFVCLFYLIEQVEFSQLVAIL